MFDKLCAYNDWANQLLISTFSTLPDEIPPLSLKLFSHIINAQCIWSGRVLNTSNTVGVWDLHDLQTCKELHTKSAMQLSDCLHMDYRSVICYKTFSGVQFENTLEEILMHVFNHGTYHRAQIATDMRTNGLKPINTDYIVYVRR